MSRSITGGAYLQVAQTTVTDEPFTIFLWFKRAGNELASTQSFAVIGDDDSAGGNSWMLRINSSDVIQARAENSAGTGGQASAGSTNDTTSWHSAAYVTSAGNSRFAYLDGTAGGENTGTSTPTSADIDVFRIGASSYSTPTLPADILAAHVAVWNIALSGTDISNLHGGDNPLAVQAANLVMCYPLVDDDLTDHSGSGLNLTNVGGTTHSTDNPTVDAPPGAGGSKPKTLLTLGIG